MSVENYSFFPSSVKPQAPTTMPQSTPVSGFDMAQLLRMLLEMQQKQLESQNAQTSTQAAQADSDRQLKRDVVFGRHLGMDGKPVTENGMTPEAKWREMFAGAKPTTAMPHSAVPPRNDVNNPYYYGAMGPGTKVAPYVTPNQKASPFNRTFSNGSVEGMIDPNAPLDVRYIDANTWRASGSVSKAKTLTPGGALYGGPASVDKLPTNYPIDPAKDTPETQPRSPFSSRTKPPKRVFSR